MGSATNLSSYDDVSGLLDEAIQTEKGTRVRVETMGEARNLAQRCNACRSNYRKRSKRNSEPESRDYGTTPWDGLRISPVEEAGSYYVYLRKYSGLTYTTEELD